MRGRTSEVGETRTSPNGYHYTRTTEGWVLTHRIIAAEKLGRPLKDNERIKFEDRDRTNLDSDNIVVYEVKKQTKGARRARLESRIAELQAELEMLDAEDS